MGISIGLVGLGGFGSTFADLFYSHPLVDRVGLCDRVPERIKAFADKESWRAKFNPRDAYPSLDEICRSDIEALVIITQHWLHAPQAVKAMESGKHVYCAVPLLCVPDSDEILEWCDRIVSACRTTGQLFMYGETTYYRPAAMFCRRKAREGAFGDFVYAEGEYFHDVDSGCSLRKVMEARLGSVAGREWLVQREKYRKAGIRSGPMHYPTHSTSGPVSVMKAHALKVTAYGYRNRNGDPYFTETDEEFSNEVALFLMSNGAVVRICEFRECAGAIADSETFRIVGTRGTYAENTWKENFRDKPFTARRLSVTKLTDEQMRDPLPVEVARAFNKLYGKDSDNDFTPRGHGGSHPYLVHEFVDAVAHGRLPAISAWDAARYTAMGAMAHKSALRGGETLTVPDWGEAPSA